MVNNLKYNRTKTRKGGKCSDVLRHKAARRNSISNFWGFKSELHTNAVPFHLESLWATTLMPHRGCAIDSDSNIVVVGKNSGPVLSCLWTKVYEIWDNAGDPLYFPTPLPDYLCHVLLSRYLPLSLEVVRNRTNVKVFLAASSFPEG